MMPVMFAIIAVLAFLGFVLMGLTCYVGCWLKKVERRIKTVDVQKKEVTSTNFEVQGVPEKLHF